MPSTPLTVADLLADPDLGLRLATPGTDVGREVVAAHVTELVRPGGWLQGGELLMTIGLLLPMTRGACEEYVADAARGGVAALAIGLGSDLPHQEAPAALVAAAAARGVPLLVVPDRTPFIAVTKAVFAARARRERQDVEAALDLDRRLTAAATGGGGVDALLAAWLDDRAGRTGPDDEAAAVLDVAGRRIGRAHTRDAALPRPDDALLGAVRRAGPRGAAAVTSPDGRTELHPLGARHVHGILVLRTGADRRAVSTLRALLTLELERRHLAGEDRRRARAEAVGRLLDPATTQPAAAAALGLAGLAEVPLRAVVVEPSSARGAAAEASDLALAVRGGLVRVHDGLVEAVVAADVDVRSVLASFAPARPAGIGPAGPSAALPASRRDAVACLPASRRLGRPVEADGASAVGLLLRLGVPDAVEAFADRVLGPLRRADPRGVLAATLRAWLDAGASLEEAATALGVHRHTVRSRLDRAQDVLGRPLADAHVRHEVWLALQARAVREPA